jgi:hypothetical protein
MKGQESIQISIKYAALLASLILFLYFTITPIVSVLLPIKKLFQRHRMPCVGICSFSIAIQLIGAAYFQAAEMLRKRCCLHLVSRALIPLVLLPNFSVF